MTPVHLADQLDGIFMTGEKDEEELLGIKRLLSEYCLKQDLLGVA